MDNKTTFTRTSKGEDEVHGKTSHIAGDVRRALLMVDGNSTFEEIKKRAAPSLRASLEEMYQELEKGGFIKNKDQAKTKIQEQTRDKSRLENIPKMSVPVKIATPHRGKPVEEDGGELDFLSGFTASDAAVAAAELEAAEAAAEGAAAEDAEAQRLKGEAEEKSRREIEAAKLNAQREAEAILHKAEQEAAKIREEMARRAREEAEATRLKAEQEARLRLELAAKERQKAEAERIKAEQEAAQLQKELEAARSKAEQEARLRLEMEAKERQLAETARIKLEAEARVQRELEAVRLKAEQEVRLRLEMEAKERQLAEAARIKAEEEARVQREIETAKVKVEQEIRLRLEMEAKERQLAEAARIKAEQEASELQKELEAARLRAEQEVKLRFEIASKERQQAEAARIKAEEEARMQNELEVARLKAELEAKAHLEAETRAYARIKAEEEALKAKEAAELAAKEASKPQEDDDIAKRMAKELTKAFEATPPGKTNAFAFDTFQVDGGKPLTEPLKEIASEKPEGFAFGEFHVDEPQQVTGTQKSKAPAQNFRAIQQQDNSNAGRPSEQPLGKQQSTSPEANKPVQSSPSQEQIQRAVQARVAAEQRAAAEAEARKLDEERAAKEAAAKRLSDEQAKIWAEAEQRALDAAKSNTGNMGQPIELSNINNSPITQSVARPRRSSFSAGKLVGIVFKLSLFLLILLVGALFVVPYVIPTRDYMPKMEKMLSERVHQPVHIGHLSGRILPMPRLELGEIYLGDAKQFQSGQAYLNFSLAGLFSDVKPIDSVEFQNIKVRGIGLQNVSSWMQQLAADRQYPVARMTISQGTLDADAFELSGIEGEMDFDQAGKFAQANLRANGGKYSLTLSAAREKGMLINFSAKNAALPLLSNWTFDDLSAKGELGGDELVISDYDAHILGGTLQGNAAINWHSGWRAQGTLNANKIEMKQLNHLLDGSINGSGRFKMSSLELAGLTESATSEGDFQAKDGMIGGMDIVETARTHSKEHLPGGRTPFDNLAGTVTYADNSYHFKQTKVAAKVANSTATFDVSKQQISGKMSVNLSLLGGSGSVVLQIGGTTDSPTLRYVP